jgi:hypothetical protein
MKHPEVKPDELFLGNHTRDEFQSIGWKGKRFGKVALNAKGKPISAGLFPVFVKRAEVATATRWVRGPNRRFEAAFKIDDETQTFKSAARRR